MKFNRMSFILCLSICLLSAFSMQSENKNVIDFQVEATPPYNQCKYIRTYGGDNYVDFEIGDIVLDICFEKSDISVDVEDNNITLYIKSQQRKNGGSQNYLFSVKVDDVPCGQYSLNIETMILQSYSDSEHEIYHTSTYLSNHTIEIKNGESWEWTCNDNPLNYIYTPLVEEGKTWSYLHQIDEIQGSPKYYHYAISGTEIGVGVPPHDAYKCYKYDGWDLDTNVIEPIAYLYEKDKKVYISYNVNHHELQGLDLSKNWRLLYNFNDVDTYSFVDINGQQRKCYISENNTNYKYIEGIGSVGEYSDLISFKRVNSEIYAPAVWTDQRVFNYITDADGKIIYESTSAEKYKYGTEDPCFTGEGAYEYVPLVREGAEWGYFTGDTAEEVDFYRLRLSGEEEINGNIYKKCWYYTDCEFSESTAALYGYLREENKRVYVLYQSSGSEHLLYDFNLQEGDQYGQHPWFNGAVTLPIESVDYVQTTEGLRKRYFVGSNVCYIEGIGIVGTHLGDMLRPNGYPYEENATFNYEKNAEGNIVFKAICSSIGASDPCLNNGVTYEYTPLVEDGKVWNYFENWGWEVIEDDYARIAMSGQEEINGKIYTKCWFYYGHCEFSEENAMLLCYMREEDKRVYMLPAVDSGYCPPFFLGYESYASDMEEAQEYLLYDFNLSAGDSYHEFPYYEDDWLNHTIESVEFIEIDGKLRKKYVLSNSHNVIEGIGIIGDFSGYVCSPNPVLPTCSYSTPRLSHISTLDGETTLVYFGGDPCLISEDEYQYEYVPVVREDIVWGYYSNTNASEGGKTTYIRFDGEEVINGKTYLKCYRSDDCSFDENKSELLGYMREEDKRVYAIVPQGDVLSEESLRYDFNLSAGDSFTRVGGNTVTISRVNNVVINGKLRKCYYYNQDATESGSCFTEGIGQWLYGDIISTDSNYRFVMEKNINTGEVFDHSRGITTLNPCDKLSVNQIAENALSFVQADDRININGATGKVNVAIYTFDGVKAAEASGSESVSLSTAELPIGIYVVKATDGRGNSLMQKIVVK